MTHNEQGYADSVFRNGRILTQDPENPQAQAVAVIDEKVVLVGSNRDIEPLIGPHTQVNDLDGYYMLPGFLAAEFPRSHADRPVYDPEDASELENWIMESSEAGFTGVCLGSLQPAQRAAFRSALNELEEYGKRRMRVYSDQTADLGDLEDPEDPQEYVELLTVISAQRAGLEGQAGTIAPGCYADFTIFDEAPFRVTMVTNRLIPEVTATVVGGEVSYDAEAFSDEVLFDLITGGGF